MNKMIEWRLENDKSVDTSTFSDDDFKIHSHCRIFLGYTSSCVSSGLRDIIRYLCEHRMVDVLCTPATGIDEDLMKCFGSHMVTKFTDADPNSQEKAPYHKIGNIELPKSNIEAYEKWLTGQIAEMHEEQEKIGTIFSPSNIARRLGEKIDNKESILYWCFKNKIPIFSPALTDGLFGDVLYKYEKNVKKGFIVDIAQDVRGINKASLTAKKTGCIILGGGLIKHHILNANLMRNGTDFSIYINTGNEWEASDAGAKPQEALSWGKLKLDCEFEKVYGEATLVFPILVSQTFAKNKEKASKMHLVNFDEMLFGTKCEIQESWPNCLENQHFKA